MGNALRRRRQRAMLPHQLQQQRTRPPPQACMHPAWPLFASPLIREPALASKPVAGQRRRAALAAAEVPTASKTMACPVRVPQKQRGPGRAHERVSAGPRRGAQGRRGRRERGRRVGGGARVAGARCAAPRPTPTRYWSSTPCTAETAHKIVPRGTRRTPLVRSRVTLKIGNTC